VDAPERDAALEELALFRAEVDARAAQLAGRHAERLQCRRGCAGCCLDDLTVFEVEAQVLRKRHPELLASGTAHAPGACAFLDAEGACRVYADRPYVCRTQGLPLAVVEERGGAGVELRDVCPLNERGAPLEELAPDALWRIGPFEERLRAIQQRFSGGSLARVPLRSLFARAGLLDPSLRRPLGRALDALEAGGRWSQVLRDLFREENWITPPARGALVGALAGLLQDEQRARAALEPQLEGRPAAEKLLAMHVASQLLRGRILRPRAEQELPGLDWERVLARDADLCASPDAVRAFAQRHSLPRFLSARLLEQYGREAPELAEALRSEAPIALRANTLKGTRDELRARLLERRILARPGALAREALRIEGFANVFEWPEFAEGRFELQDESSQLAAELVAPPRRGLVVDFCAGAGGKTLALSALMHNKGRILALDTHARRLDELRRRAARAGAFNVIPLQAPEPLATPAPEIAAARGKADRVLVDAPCSGVGVLRRKPDILRSLDVRALERLPREQLAIAREARRYLAPGGRLVYSTCTLLTEENEAIAEQLVADGMELVPAREVLGGALADRVCTADGRYLKLLPHVHGSDGFFAAVLREPRAKS
jgi:16S rRNA (cytosine967-C5)-methyltransferase